jgi:hypothetical protein
MPKPEISSATPVLYVERIEPVLSFWEKLGFEQGAAVPQGDHLGFVSLSNGKAELMYQTFDSLQNDIPALVEAARPGRTFLFLHVKSLAAVRAAVKDQAVYLPERKTFYGATELGVREPGGHYVTFAEFA